MRTDADSMDFAGHAFRKQAAGAFGPELAKKLSQLVKMEKNVMRSMELVGRERMEVAVCERGPRSTESEIRLANANVYFM